MRTYERSWTFDAAATIGLNNQQCSVIAFLVTVQVYLKSLAGVQDIDRLDVRPGKGMLKVRCKNSWEVQIDANSGKVLQVAYRRIARSGKRLLATIGNAFETVT